MIFGARSAPAKNAKKTYKPLQKSAFRKPAKRQRETLIEQVVYGWEFGSFPEIVLKMYGKPLVKQRFAVAFSPYAKTLNSLGKIVFRMNAKRDRETLIKPVIFCIPWSTFGEK